MSRKPLKVLSKSALAAVIGTSSLIPVVSVDAAGVKEINAFYLTVDNVIYEISLDLYSQAIGLGIEVKGEVSHFGASNGEFYTFEKYGQAIALTNTIHEAIEMLESGSHGVEDLNAGKVIVEDGELKYIPPKNIEKDLQVTEVSSIDKTGVTVTFPSLLEGMTDQKITVIDPDGTEVAVKVQDLAVGATEAIFEFVTEIDELTPGTWTVNGKEFVVEENTTKENETKRYLAS